VPSSLAADFCEIKKTNTMRKPLLILLLGFFLAFYAKADTEPGNNAPGTTTDVLTMGGSQSGSVGPADNFDYYQLTAGADGDITISLTNNNNEYTYIYLYDSDGATQLGTTSGTALAGISFTANGLAAGNYYVAVYNTSGTNYTVSASLATVPVTNDVEPNNSVAQATAIPINTNVTGHIGYRANGTLYDQYDYYTIVTTADGDITVSLTNTNNQYTYIYLYDNDGVTQLGSASNNAGSGISFTTSGLAAGTYYVIVYGSSAYTGYTLNAAFTPTPLTNDPEPNNTVAQFTPLPVNTNVTGHIGHRGNGTVYDTDDYYKVITSADGDITVSLTNTNNQYTYIYLYDIDGTTQLGAASNNAGSGISFTSTGLAAGTYYVRVYGSSAYTGYTLNATLTPDPVVNDPVNNSYFANAPSFAQNDSITGHIGFRNNGGGNDDNDFFSFYSNGDYDITVTLKNDNNHYTYIYLYDTDTATVLGSASNNAGGAGISFTATGLAAGTYYIRVYGGNAYTGYTLINSYTPNPVPDDTEPNNSIATATPVSFNSVNTGHIAYRNPGGSYDNYDYYVFTTPVDGNVTLSLTNNNNAYTYLYLYDSDGVTQLNATSNNAQGGISITANGLAAGTYYAIIYAGGGSYSGYTLTRSLTPTPFTADAEPDADTATALVMSPNSSLNGHIAHRYNGGSYDNYDWYKIVTTQDGDISLNLTNNNDAYTYLYLYDSDGVTQLAATSNNAQAGISAGRTGLAAGTYYAIVYAGGGSFSGYTLSNTFTAAPYTNDVESNNTPATAAVLNNNPTKSGHIGYRYNGGGIDDYDYWKITMNATDSFRLDLSFTNGNYAYVYFYNAALNQLYAQSGNGGSYSVFFNSLPAGDYYLVIYATAYNSYKVNNFYYPCNPSASAITAGGPTTFCPGGSVALNSVNAYNAYQWSTGAATGSITATATGNYTLTAFDFDGCPHVSNTIHVTVNPAPTPTITHGTPVTFCSGGNVILSTGVFSSYAWSTGATTQSITVSTTGIYTVTVMNANGCTGVSASQSVTVNPNPSTPVINASGPLTFCSNTSITLTSTAATGYLWSTGVTTQSINVNSAGTFTVTVTNANGCSATSASVTTNTLPLQTYYRDFDNDTYGNPASSIQDCSAPAGYVSNNTDCNDNSNAVHPGATELCNGTDDDCDGTVDEGCTVFTFFRDQDGDTYGDPGNTTTSVNPIPPAGYVTVNGDCNDNNAAIHPGATEICNGIDDNCNASIDEGVKNTYYADADGDTYGNPSSTQLACSPPAGFVSNNTDCNDGSAGVHPGAAEVCNGIDDNCNALIDEGVKNTYFADADGDSYGNPSSTQLACSPPSGFVSNNTDCNDNNAAVNPSATEVCNGTDDDCDGTTDEGCGGCVNAPTVFAGNDQNVCEGNNVSLNAVMGGGATMVTWSSPTNGVFMPNVNSAAATYVPSATDLSNGSVRLYISTDAPSGCNAAIDSVDITFVDLLPTPEAITGNQYICNPSSGATFTYAVAAVPGATGYAWTAGPNATIVSGQGTNSITVKFTQSAIHNGINASICVSATGPGSCGTSAQSCLAVSVQLVAPVTPGSISGPNKICPGDTGIYSISAVARSAYYTWTVPVNASIIEGQGTLTIKVAYNASYSGGGDVAVAAVNGCGSSPQRTRAILFNALPASASISGQASGLCNEQNIIYSAAPVAGATSYAWTVPAQGSIDGLSTGASIIVDYASFATGNVTVAAVNGCGAGAARLLAVTGTPSAAGTISGPLTVCTGSTNTYQVSTVTGATTYAWTVPSGTTIMNGQGTKIMNLKFGSSQAFNMVVSVRTSNACGAGPLRSLSSIAALFCTRASEETAVTVAPNPSSGKYTVDFGNSVSGKIQLTVVDISGRIVFNEVTGDNIYDMDLTALPDGIYMLKMLSENINETIRLVKN
jgi:hypothetical protein